MPVAYLDGLRTVKDCMKNEATRSFIDDVIFNEIISTLSGDQKEVKQFANEVLSRFANPFVEHQLESIALNSIAKFRVRLIPTILEYYKMNGRYPKGIIHSLAALIIFYRGHWKGQAIPLHDEQSVIEIFSKSWQQGVPGVVALLGNELLWGINLNSLPGLSQGVSAEVMNILGDE
jgi:tagaturonate reductase